MELRGDLQSFPLTQLVQTLDNAQRTGKLDIEGHEGSFAIFFQKGRVIHAQSPYSSGLPAFFDTFLVRDGTFNFLPSVIMPPRRIVRTIRVFSSRQRDLPTNTHGQEFRWNRLHCRSV